MAQVFGLRPSAQGNPDEVHVMLNEEVVDALVLHEAAVEAARQEVGSSHVPEDVGVISEMFSESETKAGPEEETRAPCRARSTVVESSDSELEGRPRAKLDLPAPRTTPTKKRTRSQTSYASRSFSALHPEVGRKKQKSARPIISKKLDPSPHKMQVGVEGQQSDKEVIAKILEELKASKPEGTS
ncbi:uncharacterized protein [Malus domestica]|uniref:uncharacterized protein n=1 Tax=Malus domestica TaxID=3750 RepID=UPI0007EE1EA1